MSAPFEKDTASVYYLGTWRNTDEHRATLSFSRVVPVNVRVRDLEVAVKTQSQRRLPWQSEAPTPTPGEAEAGTAAQQNTIISGISADFSSGSLSAIIGGSGSGKVSLIFHESCMQAN